MRALARRIAQAATPSRRYISRQHQPPTTSALPPPDFFPYAASDFAALRRDGQFLVDKTRFISQLEVDPDHILLHRPPRWGKSLLMSTLRYYYDVGQKEHFAELFDGLEAGRAPTPDRSTFHVLSLDFSQVPDCRPECLSQNLHSTINKSLMEFSARYNVDFDIYPNNSFCSMAGMADMLGIRRERLLVLVDNYDSYANKLMLENPEANSILAGTWGDPLFSSFRSFYETLEAMSKARLQAYRSFSTGILPITLADFSGFNVLLNVSDQPNLGDTVGFTEADIRLGLERIGVRGPEQTAPLAVMRRFYIGYRFRGSTQPLYNPTQSLFFLRNYQQDTDGFREKIAKWETKPMGELAPILLDEKVKIRDGVLGLLSWRTPATAQAIVEQLLNPRVPVCLPWLQRSFSLRELLNPLPEEGVVQDEFEARDRKCTRERMLSFMFYHGMVTLADMPPVPPDAPEVTVLCVPNEMMRGPLQKSLAQALKLSLSDVMSAIVAPTPERVKAVVWDIIRQQQALHDNSFSEDALQGEVEAALRATAAAGNGAFEVVAEHALCPGQADLVLTSQGHTLLLEFKRVQPDALILRDAWPPGVCSPEYLRRIQQQLGEMTNEELRGLEIRQTERSMYGDARTVSELDELAMMQTQSYLRDLRAQQPGRAVAAFTVVQVGWPVLVRQVLGGE